MDLLNKIVVKKIFKEIAIESKALFLENPEELQRIFRDHSRLDLQCAILCGMAYNWHIQDEFIKESLLNPNKFDVFVLNKGSLVFSTYNYNDILIVAFKGSTTISDFLTDIKLTLTETIHGKVHSGFFELLTKNNAHLEIIEIIRQFKPKQIVLSGHSLGAALATLLLQYLSSLPAEIKLITFGSPRVGDREFAKNIQNSKRHIYENDAVTKLPLSLNYSHIESAIQINKSCPIKFSVSNHSIDNYIYALKNI
jgi:predicted lipase